MDLGLKLDAIESKNDQQEIEKVMPDVFKDVVVQLVLPNGTELVWNYAIGESLQTLKKRLHDEQHYSETSKFYLEEKTEKTYMMDPLSLNDFERVRRLATEGKTVRILVEGPKLDQ